MPYEGEISTAKELGRRSTFKYQWVKCPQCGQCRWTNLVSGKPRSLWCKRCRVTARGKESPRWKGGIRKSKGYIRVWIAFDDFYFPMATKDGCVLEHRLVMAKHLNRCLLPWEVVHHINGIKDDNRIENLELLPHPRFHLVDAITKSYIANLELKIEELTSKLEVVNGRLPTNI